MPVGSYLQQGKDKPTIDYRDIGVVIEFSDDKGNCWEEIKLHADILNPSLLILARGMMDKGQASCRVKMFDVQRQTKDKSMNEDDGPSKEDDDIPFN